ncbi:MAG: HEAT repeat domain-containing protein [Gemmataceae bacterium]|nr:HEAT repeat domain-containing protein [Gemmataceae bacterium]
MKVASAAGITLLSLLTVAWGGGGTAPKKEDVPKYLEMLKKSASAKDRALAAEMLGKRGAIKRSDVAEAVEPLKKALEKDTDAGVRAKAAEALGYISPEAKDTVPLLTKALEDKNFSVKLAVMSALSQFGAEAKSALPALREIAKEKTDKKLSQAANQAIKIITGKQKN